MAYISMGHLIEFWDLFCNFASLSMTTYETISVCFLYSLRYYHCQPIIAYHNEFFPLYIFSRGRQQHFILFFEACNDIIFTFSANLVIFFYHNGNLNVFFIIT